MMQMQKIKKLCLGRGAFVIVNGGSCQWLGNTDALYAVPRGARIDAEMLETMFDLAEKQSRECMWSVKYTADLAAAGINLEDNDESDVPLRKLAASVSVAGDDLAILWTDDKDVALLVKSEYLVPAEKYHDAQYYARKLKSGWAVVVKNGYCIVAYIMPWTIGGDAISDLILRVRDVLGMVIASERSQRAKEESGSLLDQLKAAYGEGAGIDEETGEETGEVIE